MREYPYEEGEFTIIGPECFASESGRTISWRGENYYSDERITEVMGWLSVELRHRPYPQPPEWLELLRRALEATAS